MAGKGAPKGMRYGGRTKGVPNKTTRQRAAVIQKQIKKSGAWLAIERLSKVADEFDTLAAQYKPGKSETPDETKYVQYLSKMASILADLVPYQTAKLQSTTISGNRDQPVSAELVVRFV